MENPASLSLTKLKRKLSFSASVAVIINSVDSPLSTDRFSQQLLTQCKYCQKSFLVRFYNFIYYLTFRQQLKFLVS